MRVGGMWPSVDQKKSRLKITHHSTSTEFLSLQSLLNLIDVISFHWKENSYSWIQKDILSGSNDITLIPSCSSDWFPGRWIDSIGVLLPLQTWNDPHWIFCYWSIDLWIGHCRIFYSAFILYSLCYMNLCSIMSIVLSLSARPFFPTTHSFSMCSYFIWIYLTSIKSKCIHRHSTWWNERVYMSEVIEEQNFISIEKPIHRFTIMLENIFQRCLPFFSYCIM